jgi:DNA-binding beta-propeller fold protein YncE
MEARGLFKDTIPPVLLGLAVLLVVNGFSTARSPDYSTDIWEIRALDADEQEELLQRGVDLPLGVEHLSSLQDQSGLFTLVLGELGGSSNGRGPPRLATVDPLNMAYDGNRRRLFVIEEGTHELLGIRLGAEGRVDSQQIAPVARLRTHLESPRGMTLDRELGRLFILDGTASKILEIELDSSLEPREISLSSGLAPFESGVAPFRGLAFNSADGHLYLLGSTGNALSEITDSGGLVAVHDVSRLGFGDPGGLLFAPTSDRTDDPSATSLFFASAGLDSLVREFAVRPPLRPRLRQIREEARLVQTIGMPRFSRSTPELAGVTYLQSVGTLLASDSEADETSGLAEDNLFEMTLLGTLVDSLSTSGFSQQPSGVTYNPGNNHLFFTDAGADEVVELDPGPDGSYDTGDDTVTSFDTRAFESFDPEGVAFDSWTGALLVVDGINSEVYRIASGANGV